MSGFQNLRLLSLSSHASGRRFAVIEGGYNPDGLAEAAEALLDGLG